VQGTFGTSAAVAAFVAAAGLRQGVVELDGDGGGFDGEREGVGRDDAADGPGLADGVVVGRELAEVRVGVADGDAEPKPGGGRMLTLRPK
jgi:hypothetical protein